MNNAFDLSYYNIYTNLRASEKKYLKGSENKKDDIRENMNHFLDYVCSILIGLEENISYEDEEFEKLLRNNLENSIKNIEFSKNQLEKHNSFAEKIFYDNKAKKSKKSNREILKDVINYIESISKEIINFDNIGYDNNNETIENKELDQTDMNKVFLSYAHDDKLYTYGLYHYFINYGIYLHIDWMHNGLISDPYVLKNTLNNDMSKCSQFLFCRSINSELRVKGGHIRQWCAWEIGNYYCKNLNQKFYTQIYQGSVLPGKSPLLNTLKPLKGVKDKKLY